MAENSAAKFRPAAVRERSSASTRGIRLQPHSPFGCGSSALRCKRLMPRGRREGLARISHHLTAEARDKAAITSLRLLTVLTVLFKYASAR